MLKDATGFKKIYIAAGKTDLRKGMDSLAAIVSLQFELDPYETDILFLFCGSTRRLIKGLVWEGDGFVSHHFSPIFLVCSSALFSNSLYMNATFPDAPSNKRGLTVAL